MLKVAITTALATAFAVPAFANPFTDVPVKHWSYDAVAKLAQAGVIDGYNDGTFKGDKTVTRYEMAQIVAKAMQKSLSGDQKQMMDKLAREFSVELNTLGVKVEDIQQQLDGMVKLSGDARVRYANVTDTAEGLDMRARLNVAGKVADGIGFNARLSTGNVDYKANNSNVGIQLDTANVNFAALGMNHTLGRQDIKLGSGFIMDSQFTGIGTQAGDLKVFAGNTKSAERIYAAEYGTKLLGADVTADYLKNEATGDKFLALNTGFKVAKDVTAMAEYVKNDANDSTAYAYGVKFDKIGLSATYRNAEAGAYTGYSTVAGDLNAAAAGTAIKGMEYQYDHNFNKNTNLNVKYQDFENQNTRAAATVNLKF